MMKLNLKTVMALLLIAGSSINSGKAQTINTICGTGLAGYSGDGGPAISAQLKHPTDVKIDAKGNTYIVDQGNEVIRKINAAGIITTIAGEGDPGYFGDGGPATLAAINVPTGIAVDKTGNLYIADTHNGLIRKVDTNGIISTIAGSYNQPGYTGNGGPASAARITDPTYMAIDTADNLYFTDHLNNAVRMISHSTGIIITVAGNTIKGYNGDGGPGPAAQLNDPRGIYLDTYGNLFIADFGNDVIRRVDGITKNITTIAGKNWPGATGTGGPATNACLNGPISVTADNYGNVFFGEYRNDWVRKVNTRDTLVYFAGNGYSGFSGDGGPSTASRINYPYSLSVDGVGNVYFPDYTNSVIRRVQVSPLKINTGNEIGGIQIFPNPVTEILHINNVQPSTSYSLTNAVGVEVRTGELAQGDQFLSIKELPSGIYNLELNPKEGNREIRKIIKQ